MQLVKSSCSCLDEIVSQTVKALNKERTPFKVLKVMIWGLDNDRQTTNTLDLLLVNPETKEQKEKCVLKHIFCPFCGKPYNNS